MSIRRAVGAALGGGALVLVGFLFDAAPLFVPGIAFLALGAAAPAWVRLCARSVSVARRIEQDRVIEGEPFEAWLELRGGPLGLAGGELRDPLAGRPLHVPLGRNASIRVLAQFERRGLRRLAPPSLRVRDPLELAECICQSPGSAQDVLVLPRTEAVQWARRDGASGISRTSRARAELLAAVEIDGLRPYRPGTPASRIHWPALARGAGLLERRLRVDGDTLPLVVLDARGATAEEHLDNAVRAAASLTLELARTGGVRLLLPGARRALAVESDLTSWPLAYTRLALVEGGPAVRPPAPAAIRGALGPVFYVAAQRRERLPSTLGRETAAASATVLVVPAPLTAGVRGRQSFAVCGCVGFVMRSTSRLTPKADPLKEATA